MSVRRGFDVYSPGPFTTGIPLYASDGGFTFDKCKFTGHSFEVPMIMGSGTSATFTGCEFSGNDFSASYTVLVSVTDYDVATFTNTVFLDLMPDSSPTSGNHFIRYDNSAGTLNVTGCTFNSKNPPAIEVPAGTKGTRTGNTFL